MLSSVYFLTEAMTSNQTEQMLVALDALEFGCMHPKEEYEVPQKILYCPKFTCHIKNRIF